MKRSFVRRARRSTAELRVLCVLVPTALGLACSGSVLDGPGGAGPASEVAGPGGSSPGVGSSPGSPGAGPGNAAGNGSAPSPAQCAMQSPPRARIWRLTHAQFKHTVQNAFGFSVPSIDTLPDESRLDGFANASDRLVLSSALFEYYGRAAEDIAAEALKRSGELLGCAVTALGTGTCLADFVSKVGERAWRRPLAGDEVARLTKLYGAAAADLGPEGGFRTLVQGLVLSANFLFRTELGDGTSGTTKLTDLELASALSYMLWDGPPDAALLELAKQGKLRDPDTLAGEARRLTNHAKAPEALFAFVQQWLEIEDFTEKPKDAMAFPMFSVDVARELEEETRVYVKNVLFSGETKGNVRTLMTAPFGYLTPRTAALYGKEASGTGHSKVELDPAQRRGILTQGSFLAAHAEPVHTSVVARGRFMREEVLCSEVPAPPAEFKFDEKVITEDMTAREKFIEHSKNPACKGCHVMFDTLGFALENYDAIGRWRTTEKNKTIDPSGTIPLPSGKDVTFKNFVDLVEQLGKGTDVYDCFAEQYLQYVNGRVKLDGCERAAVARAFAESGHTLDALVMAIVKSPSFMARSN